jgi:SH3-like domain-containing protein
LVAGRRTALVAPWKKEELLPLRSDSSDGADVTANLQAGVIGSIKKCDGTWCRIFGSGFDGYIKQTDLWGVYPGELVD